MSRRKRPADDDEPEGGVSYAEAGISFAELEASGLFDCVTDEHRRKATAYFAKIEAKRAPGLPAQGDLFA